MESEKTKYQIDGGNNQFVPNATTAIQVFVGDDFVRKAQENLSVHHAEVMDMCYFSVTMPDKIEHEIQRLNYLDFFDSCLKENSILCLTGEDGVGVTTLLAQFVKRHAANCVSFFNNGLQSIRLNSDVVEQNLYEQLYWFAFGEKVSFEKIGEITSLTNFVLRKLKQTNQELYFVFDGFDDIPSEKLDSLRRLFSNMLWDKGRFIFSGKKEKIKELLPSKLNLAINQTEIMRFGEAEVAEYFRKSSNKALTQDDQILLYSLTRGNAQRMNLFRRKYVEKGDIEKLRTSEYTGESNLHDEDYKKIFLEEDTFSKDFFALLSYIEFPLKVDLAAKILQIQADYLVKSVNGRLFDYVKIDGENIVSFKEESFHKYLRLKLVDYKQKIELRVIDVLENEENPLAYCNYLPGMYKSVNQIDKLINYLNSNNVQKILVNKRSQAALNEQCDFGYDACFGRLDKYAANIFRFALNKSASREIEKNILWDNEIEAMLSVGQYEQAIALAETVYLSEERLKAYLLIAKKKDVIPNNDYIILRERIKQLVSSIDFENIPNKAVEIAKMLMPIDVEAATAIIERIAKVQNDISVTDKLYAMLSMAYSKDEEGNVTNFDLVNSKIKDDNLRIVANTAKHLFDDMDVDQFLKEVSKLPSNSQKLYFLQFWLPDHEDKADIGKVILEGIRLVVAESDSEIPRARLLNSICKSMRKMMMPDLEKAIVYLESMGGSIKYPTFDYVDLQLNIIESIKDKMAEKSKSMLVDLYYYIICLEDESVKMACLSKLLGKYDRLGVKSEIEKETDSTVTIRKTIIDGIHKLLHETAYHLKVIEEPIKALVCTYPTMIDEIIEGVNTRTRKSRAYSLAAIYYLLNQDEDKIDLSYFFTLLSKTDDVYSDRLKPIALMSDMLISAEKIQHTKMLSEVKRNFYYVENIESSKNRSIICMRIYLWLKKNFPEDSFANKVKTLLLTSWESIDEDCLKIEIGFYIAKQFSKVSKDEACDFISKCKEVKDKTLLSSSSCVETYNESLRLYTLSLSNLIKLGLCDEAMLHDFCDDVDGLLSSVEKVILWGNVALDYKNAKKDEMFDELGDKYFPVDYSKYSLFDQKRIIYCIAPALYYRSQTKFFTLLSNYDETFRNDSILYVCKFIMTKQTYLMDSNLEHQAYELKYCEYIHLLDLLENSSNDENFFTVIDIICKSLRITNKKVDPLSTDQKNTIIGEAERIVNAKLPSVMGIKHDGYKIACLAALSSLKKDFNRKDFEIWEKQIGEIDNKADQAFLYFLLAPYFAKRPEQQLYFEKGIAISESISSTFDKVRRLDMSISECLDYKLGSLVPNIAKSAMKSLANNGSLEDHKRLIDMAYQHNPELAGQLVDMLDKDPARLRYKRKLEKHIASVKKLEQAKKDMASIEGLSKKEQCKFFETQLANLVGGKGQLYDVNKIFSLAINFIFNNSIIDAHDSLVYLMETIARKHQQSKNQKELLFSIHKALKYNLKLVLSLASETKERLDRIQFTIQDHTIKSDGLVDIGEYQKGITYLLNWFRNTALDELIIIDPYFCPDDLAVIKQLTDLNTNISISILCHGHKHKPYEYEIRWHQLSAGVQIPILVHFLSYEEQPDDGPLHDRYWICQDCDWVKHAGVSLNSISGLGRKASSILEIEEDKIDGILNKYYTPYVYAKIPSKDNRKLLYDELTLD